MAKKRRKFDLATQERLCAMVSIGTSVRSAAILCHTPEATVRQRQLRDPAFRERLTEAKQLREIMPLKRLREAAATNWRAAAWLLQRVRPEEYAERKPYLWRTEDVISTLRQFAEMIGKVVAGQIGSDDALDRVREEIVNNCRKVEEVWRSGSDLVPGHWPKVSRNGRGPRRAPGEDKLIDDEFRDVGGAGEVNGESDRGFPGQGARP